MTRKRYFHIHTPDSKFLTESDPRACQSWGPGLPHLRFLATPDTAWRVCKHPRSSKPELSSIAMRFPEMPSLLPWRLLGPWRAKAYINHMGPAASGPSQSYLPLEGAPRASVDMILGNLDGYALEVTLTAANSAAQVSIMTPHFSTTELTNIS